MFRRTGWISISKGMQVEFIELRFLVLMAASMKIVFWDIGLLMYIDVSEALTAYIIRASPYS
jgi:hypothetical protein